MDKFWDLWSQLGEMLGSTILSFGVLIILFFAKKESLGINTNLKKRMFLGITVPIAVILGLIAAKGFGAHGQINPAITLMVAGIEGAYDAVPMTIIFQLIGALIAVVIFLVAIWALGEWSQLETSFNFIDQSIRKTVAVEIIGNMFWLIPIAAMVVAYLHQHIDFFELAISAAFGKVLLMGVFEEFGAANFNAQIWFAKFIVTFIAKRKITKVQLFAELSGLTTNLAMGAALGPFAKLFHDNTSMHLEKVNAVIVPRP